MQEIIGIALVLIPGWFLVRRWEDQAKRDKALRNDSE